MIVKIYIIIPAGNLIDFKRLASVQPEGRKTMFSKHLRLTL